MISSPGDLFLADESGLQTVRTFRPRIVKSNHLDKRPPGNEKDREAAIDRYSPSLIRERIHRRKMLDCRDAVARRLKTGSGLSA